MTTEKLMETFKSVLQNRLSGNLHKNDRCREISRFMSALKTLEQCVKRFAKCVKVTVKKSEQCQATLI